MHLAWVSRCSLLHEKKTIDVLRYFRREEENDGYVRPMKAEGDLHVFIHSTILQRSVHIYKRYPPELTNTTVSVFDVTALGSIAELSKCVDDNGPRTHHILKSISTNRELGPYLSGNTVDSKWAEGAYSYPPAIALKRSKLRKIFSFHKN